MVNPNGGYPFIDYVKVGLPLVPVRRAYATLTMLSRGSNDSPSADMSW